MAQASTTCTDRERRPCGPVRAALKARFAWVRCQRCQFHLQRNAEAYGPRVSLRPAVASGLRAIFDASDRSSHAGHDAVPKRRLAAPAGHGDAAETSEEWETGRIH